MKRIAERALLGGLVGGLALFANASCSSTAANPPIGGGNAPGAGGSSAMNHGGASTVGTAGSSVGIGGNGLPQGGTGTVGTAGSSTFAGSAGVGQVGTAGSSASGGSGGAAAACSTDPNLLKATGCFVGCDPALTTDNPQGIQGAFYLYADGTPTTPKSCAPFVASNPPCTATGICLTGKTLADMDYTTGWGCGIGLSLNDSGGVAGVKQQYAGPATCFSYTLTGDSGGNEVRINFTQSASPGTAPYISIPAFTGGKTGTACFKDASCNGIAGCIAPSVSAPSGYDIQFQVVGANHAGSYNMCLTNLAPVVAGATTLSQICGAPGATDGTEAVGKYFAQNNVNSAQTGWMQCITPNQAGANVGFKVDSSTIQPLGDAPAAYPSIVDGWHYGKQSTDPALPLLLSKLASAQSSVTYTGSNGKYDAAYDIWVLPGATGATPNGGLEVMLWLNYAGAVPNQTPGSQTTSFMGFTRYTATVSGGGATWKYVAYTKTGPSSFSGDLKPFIQDAATQAGLTSGYLAGIQFGFELWQSGSNFAVNSFSSTVVSN